MSTLKVNTIQNTSGVTQYTAQAWVNFNGTGTVAIRASGNVSSITDNGTGNYTVNFTTAFADTSFVLAGSAGSAVNSGVDNGVVCLYNRATSSVSILVRNVQSGGAATDYDTVNAAVFR